jgi:hypothetical protein
MPGWVAIAVLALQDVDGTAAMATDIDPAVRAKAIPEAKSLCRKHEGYVLKQGTVPSQIVLALAGKMPADKLWAVPDWRAKLVACELMPPNDAHISELINLLRSGDLTTRIAAGRALGRYPEASRVKITPELSKLRTADAKLDVLDALNLFVQAHWNPGTGSSLSNYAVNADPAIAEAAAAAIINLPDFEPNGYFYSGLSSMLRKDTIDLRLRKKMLELGFKGPAHNLVPLLTLPDASMRAAVVDAIDKALDNPLLVKPLVDIAKPIEKQKLDDGKDPSQPLMTWIEAWLKKLTGQEGGVKAAEEWTRRKFASLVDAMTDKAIKKGAEALKKEQQPDGTWKYSYASYDLGATALAVYTLLKCDVLPDDRAVLKGLEALLAKDPPNTYTAALMSMAFATALEKIKEHRKASNFNSKIQPRLQKVTDVLVASQKPCGGWSYDVQLQTGTGVQNSAPRTDTFDFSNVQFAVLGLRAAANNGARVPRSTWERALALYERENKKKDGGWPYTGATPGAKTEMGSSQTMTAAGAYGWLVCKTSLNERLPLEELRQDPTFAKACEFTAKSWTWPKSGGDQFYFLYSLERMCMAAKLERLLEHDWYGDGAGWLLQRQGASGLWTGSYGSTADTCLALLFLKRAFIRTPYIETDSGKEKKK